LQTTLIYAMTVAHAFTQEHIAMIIRVETWIDNQPASDDGSMTFEARRDIDYRNKGHRIWLAKHTMWCFNNGRGVQTYRIA
jgi:hypothetical protein